MADTREIWTDETCPHCEFVNLFCMGDTTDLAIGNEFVCDCWQCGRRWIVHDVLADVQTEYANHATTYTTFDDWFLSDDMSVQKGRKPCD